ARATRATAARCRCDARVATGTRLRAATGRNGQMTAAPPRGRRFPSAAIVGQEEMKLALLLNAINPAIGGVLIRGNKGTAKSTAVRSLTKLLPGLDIVADCRYGCPPDDADLQCSECTDRVVG